MSVKIITGTAASSEVFVDTNGCVFTTTPQLGSLPAHPSAGGYYTVTGGTSAVVAAALAANTMLMSMRFSAGSTRNAYVTKCLLTLTPATLGASAGVAGTLGLIRFTAQTPTGGTARTPNEQNEPLTTATDMTDVRDSNAALTGTAPTFGNVVASTLVPLFVASAGSHIWLYEPVYPVRLQAGDGLALRTIVAMAATQTWLYNYTIEWFEK